MALRGKADCSTRPAIGKSAEGRRGCRVPIPLATIRQPRNCLTWSQSTMTFATRTQLLVQHPSRCTRATARLKGSRWQLCAKELMH
jgi:hypothetical protein